MTDWSPEFVLPNISLAEPIEGGFAALAPTSDPRVRSLTDTHRNFRELLGRFTDAFGVRLDPTIFLLRPDTPKSFRNIEALAAFRDLVAISVIGYNRAIRINNSGSHGIFFGNYFSFYPWMIDKRYDNIVASTAAVRAGNDVDYFQGQSSPEIPRMHLDPGSIDKPLLSKLTDRWNRRFCNMEDNWSDRVLFRSLNMAFHASMVPSTSDFILYDVGRLMALWVSAFEILSHPDENEKVTRNHVLELIDKAPWAAPRLRKKSCKIKIGKEFKVITLGSFIYNLMHKLRNDFIHGNAVNSDVFRPFCSKRSLFEYTSPLYRMALAAFLPLGPEQSVALEGDIDRAADHISRELTYCCKQRIIENALLTAAKSSGARRV